MNKQEATELRETIMRELPDGFTCDKLNDQEGHPCPEGCNPATWNDSWFYINSSDSPFHHIMAIFGPEDWELLKRFSLAYAGNWHSKNDQKTGYYDDEKEEWVKVTLKANPFDPDYS